MFKKKHFTALALCLALVMVSVGATAVAAYAASNEKDGSNDGAFISGTIDGVNYIHSTDGGNTWITDEEYKAKNPDAATPIEFWEITEFEAWMEQERAVNQKRADNGEISFCEKNEDEIYVMRAWTQEDVDTLYKGWQNQLARMKQGYRYTKTIDLSNGGYLVGEFDPDVSITATAPGSTVITLPNVSEVNLIGKTTVSAVFL